jgi:ATP-binding cassette, subfamily B, bacterial
VDRGQVVEVGPHDELMARQGHYWRLYQAQARQVDSEGDERETETSRIAQATSRLAHIAQHAAQQAGNP